MTLHPTPEHTREEQSHTSRLAATPSEARLTPNNVSEAFLQAQIDRLQARCDALRGKAGYRPMLARLMNAKTAALAWGVRNGS